MASPPQSTVGLRNFDEGVVITLRPFIRDDNYWLDIPNTQGPEGDPGIPIIFSNPEDVFAKKKFPCVVVQRDSVAPTMNRWHGYEALQYRLPATGALAKTVTGPGGVTVTGYDRMEQLTQAMPFDIGYTISIHTVGRSGANKTYANNILNHVLKVYQPYNIVYVRDSLGDLRTYQGYMEGVAVLDNIPDIAERHIGFAITLRVEAELDINDPGVFKTVTQLPAKTLSVKTTIK